jgi:hypothetical protein
LTLVSLPFGLSLSVGCVLLGFLHTSSSIPDILEYTASSEEVDELNDEEVDTYSASY